MHQMYDRSAAYYDLIYRELKDYRLEAEKIDTLLKRFDSSASRLLDVGCGTGEHAKRLSQDHGYKVDGVDIEPTFVEISQEKNPEGRFVTADMKDFDLGRSYDALLCLFSSIGYSGSLEGLRQSFRCFARHLKRNGLLLCEPWVDSDHWSPGLIDTTETRDPASGLEIKRVREASTEGKQSVLSITYTVAVDGRSESFAETHRLGLFSKAETNEALEQAGFELLSDNFDPIRGRLFVATRR